MKKKVFVILGTRPEIIKFSPLIKKLKAAYRYKMIFTGQHYSKALTETIFQDLNLPEPDFNLKIGSGTHGEQTGKMLMGIEKILLKEKPDAVIVQGDTNSTMAGALAAAKLNIKVVHIEAGARCFNKDEPEEINRIIADHIADLNFSFSDESKQAILDEGLKKNHFKYDNTIYEATFNNSKLLHKSSILKDCELIENDFVLVTIHRACNTNEKKVLKNIVDLLNETAKEEKIIFPIHPRTKKLIKGYKLKLNKKIQLVDPVGYLDLLSLIKNSKFVMSDSGGIVDESVVLNTPLFIIRAHTERTDIVRAGKAQLLNPTQPKEKLLSEAKRRMRVNNLNKMKTTKFKFDRNVADKMIKRIESIL